MDRATVYTQEQGRSVDFLFAQRATMIGLAKLSQAAFGSGTVVRGLAVTPNSPAALNVLVGIGEIYAMTQVDATTWGALPADTTDIILKQGLNMAAQTISTPAPTTSGYSINYLIEAQYQDQDTNPVVPPFYNSNNPQIPLNGQGGLGGSLPTERQGVCVIQAKAGIAATTGTQTTPSVDSGWTALAVVTVANGQSTVVSGNISVPPGVPQVTNLLQMMQTGSAAYAVDTSTTANTISIALTPAITAYADGQEITFKAANSNTGPCTINFGGGAVNLVGAAGALQGGEIVAGNQYTGLYSASLNEVVLNSQTAGALQVNPATKSEHATQLQQTTNKFAAFTSSGSWVVPTGITAITLSGCAGGGGGGGGGGATNVLGTGAGGAGGGAGQSILNRTYAVTPGSTISITIGAAGSGGSAGLSTANGGNGTAGGNTVISGAGFNGGTAVTLTGGGAGGGGTYFSNTGVPAGAGNAIGFPQGSCGSDGATGFNGNGIGGMGASGPFGGGGGLGRAGSNGVAGSAAYGYGAGGGAGGGGYGSSGGGAVGGTGGAGTGGYVLIAW